MTTSNDVIEMVGLAVRAHRRALHISQRELAARRGWSKWLVAALESRAQSLRFGVVASALQECGYTLAVARTDEQGLLQLLGPEDFPWSEQVAVVRDGSRRFPAHHRVVTGVPEWLAKDEACLARSSPPGFCAPFSERAAALAEARVASLQQALHRKAEVMARLTPRVPDLRPEDLGDEGEEWEGLPEVPDDGPLEAEGW